KYMVARNFDGTLAYTFMKAGKASSILNERSQDLHGHTIIRNTAKMTYNNADLLAGMVVEQIDAKGEKTTTTRSFEYHDGAKFYDKDTQRVKRLEETVTSPGGETRTLSRDHMEYDEKGNLTRFEEKSKDENGKESQRWWWDATYDENNNLTSYKDLSRAEGVDTYVDWSGGTYTQNPNWSEKTDVMDKTQERSKWLLTGYERKIRSGDGTVSKESWSNMTYNGYENLTGYDRETVDYQGYKITTSWSGQFDEFDRVASYSQTITDAFGHTQKTELKDAVYNTVDDMLGYTETTTSGDGQRVRIVSGNEYDSKHNLLTSYEKITDSHGRVTLKDWSAQGKDLGYDDKGRLKGYREKEIFKDGETVLRRDTTTTGITYDGLQRRSGGMENRHIYGNEFSGQAVDLREVVETLRTDETIKEETVTLDESLGVQMRMRQVTGYEETRKTGVLDMAGSSMIRQFTEHTSRTDITPAGAYKENKRTVGKDPENPDRVWLDSAVQTERDGVVIDGFGRMVRFKETTTQNGKPGTRTRRETDRMVYDADGNLLASHERSVADSGVTMDTERAKTQYDMLGRVKGYESTVVQEAEGIRKVSQVARDRVTYSGLNDVAGYHESVSRDDSDLKEEIEWTGAYNLFGQNQTSGQTTRRFGGDGGSRYDVTDVTRTYDMAYNPDGTLKGSVEELVSSASPDKMTISILDNATYDDAGRMSGYEQARHEVSAGAVGHDGSGRFVIDESKAALHDMSRSTRSETAYNAFGLATGYTEVLQDNGLTTANKVSGIHYDSHGRMRETHSVTRKSGEEQRLNFFFEGQRLTSLQLAALLDASAGATLEGLVGAGVLEAKYETQTVNEEAASSRTGITYDGFGQMLDYTDTMFNADGSIVVIRTSNVKYDSFGRMLSYQTDTNQSGTVGRLVYKLNGDIVTAQGLTELLADGSQSVWGLLQGDPPVLTIEIGTNELGRESNTRRSGLQYNSHGQLVGYQEASSDPANGVLAQTTSTTMTYAKNGQTAEQKTLTITQYTTGARSESVNTMTFSYAENGQPLGAVSDGTSTSYEIPVYTDMDQDGTPETLTTPDPVVSTSRQLFRAFNGQTQLIFQSSESTVEQPDGKVDENLSHTFYIYDPTGRLIGGVSESRNTSVDGFGTTAETKTTQLMSAFQGELKAIISISAGAVNNVDTSTSRSVTTTVYNYDEQGIGTYGFGAGETVTDDPFGSQTVERNWQMYYFIAGQFRLIDSDSSSETHDVLEGGGEGGGEEESATPGGDEEPEPGEGTPEPPSGTPAEEPEQPPAPEPPAPPPPVTLPY
ncbi:MAG: hypothetical protein HY548_07195, partial [Elusimicrobia bacterium]|nr:hypothetical protein [Elusimicrobiota bacterium]